MKLSFGQRLKALGIGLGLAFSGRAAETQVLGTSGQAGLFPSLTNPAKKHGAAWLKMFEKHPWLHIAVERIAENVASVPWHLYNSKGKEKKEILDHPFLSIIQRPSPQFSGYILKQLAQAYIELRGEAFWIFERNGLGVVKEIWPVPPTWVLETPRTDFPFYRINLRGKQYTPPEADIAWFKKPSLVDPYGRGAGAAESAGDDVESDEYAAKWQKRFFSNSARPDIVLTAKNQITSDNAKRLQEQWQQKYGGFWNAFKPAVLDNGVDITVLTKGQQEMDFVESRKSARDNIIGNFGIPLSVLGIVEDVNRANAEAGERIFQKNVILPRCIFWRDEYNKILAAEYGKGLYFDFDNPVPEDRETDRAEANDGISRGVITVNEWRKEMGWDPRPDGDVLLVPLNLIPTPTLKSASPNQPPPPTKSSTLIITRQAAGIQISDEEWERRWTIFVRRTEPRERNFQRILASFWQDQQDEVEAKLKLATRGFQDIAGSPDDFLFDSGYWGDLLNQKCDPILQDALKAAGLSALEDIGSSINFDLYDPRVKSYITERLNKYLGKKITDQVHDALRQELVAGYESGESITQIMDRVGSVYDAAKGWKAERIARTEIVGSSNFGALTAYSQAGVEKKSWLAALTERTRPTHIAAHYKYQENPIPMDKPFKVGAGAGQCPGDIGLAEEDCNCRCTVLPVIQEIEEA